MVGDGLDRLVFTVRATMAEGVCATVMADVSAESPAGDVAVLAVRRPG